jgi:hypothetical protein
MYCEISCHRCGLCKAVSINYREIKHHVGDIPVVCRLYSNSSPYTFGHTCFEFKIRIVHGKLFNISGFHPKETYFEQGRK